MAQSQEDQSVSDQIFGMNEAMIGRFDALNERIDKLESTLTDDALAVSGAQEALIMGLQQKFPPKGAGSPEWFADLSNRLLLHVYTVLFSLAIKNGLDPMSLVNEADESFEELFLKSE